MKIGLDSRTLLRAAGATLAAIALTLSMDALGASSTTAGLTFLVIVVWTATRVGIRISLYVALLCAFLFEYNFLPPYHSIRIASGAEWVAVITFVASSLVAGRVSERARREAQQAEQRRAEIDRLYTLSQEMMLREDAAALTQELPGLLERTFGLERVVLYMRDQEKFHASVEGIGDELAAAMRQQARAESAASTLEGEFEAHALLVGSRSVGALAWRPQALSRELATAVCAQVAIALTRAMAIAANARLEASRQSERLRGALIDSLTHELRTPLTSIRAAATTLMEPIGLDDATRLDLAAIVDEEASRLDHLIGEAVEMAEIDSKVLKINEQPHLPISLLRNAADHSRSALQGHVVEIEPGDGDTPALFDARLMGRVLRHLLENAARYSPKGSRIVLSTKRAEERLEFSVRDNGPGIDPADLPLIFEKFHRGRRAAKFGKGSGMGLAIARALLRAHGGAIEAASTLGEGATFRFWIPLKPVIEAQEDARAAAPTVRELPS
ncbi:sensor histidine kinase [Occallatibacter riparius]|uniref:histidine kinase n=1 Tax=Occallatibacter riparius TaxID=1002689 RepID=A0A9J7BGE5_9BACT|nr:ATP-binding protein [Occallatibacter riparius]UWZ81856.1 ATP-binding protein [Occallatibacter riparius]